MINSKIIMYIDDEDYVVEADGKRATTSQGVHIKVPSDYIKHFTRLKK
jgi:hypothetical protein|tara:strand:+ start:273 stop:416 length:144 start_codon:yes stop_codon:yes gene_type:complete